jgi:cytochrome oxidase Cu insertion factor (SCO1/SenC/PrrC family)
MVGGSVVCRKTPNAKTPEMTQHRVLRYNQGREVDGEREAAMDINDKAPEFTLPDQNGDEVSLKDFRGKTVVLFFFPKADTPG